VNTCSVYSLEALQANFEDPFLEPPTAGPYLLLLGMRRRHLHRLRRRGISVGPVLTSIAIVVCLVTVLPPIGILVVASIVVDGFVVVISASTVIVLATIVISAHIIVVLATINILVVSSLVLAGIGVVICRASIVLLAAVCILCCSNVISVIIVSDIHAGVWSILIIVSNIIIQHSIDVSGSFVTIVF
jgi:hypothetical protein